MYETPTERAATMISVTDVQGTLKDRALSGFIAGDSSPWPCASRQLPGHSPPPRMRLKVRVFRDAASLVDGRIFHNKYNLNLAQSATHSTHWPFHLCNLARTGADPRSKPREKRIGAPTPPCRPGRSWRSPFSQAESFGRTPHRAIYPRWPTRAGAGVFLRCSSRGPPMSSISDT